MIKLIDQKRGLFLTVLLVLQAIGLAFGVLGLLGVGAMVATTGLPAWYLPLTVVSLVLSAATLYGIWKWKKWGVYALVASYVLSLGTTFMSSQSAQAPAGAMYGGVAVTLVIAGLWYWAIYKKWKNFK